MLKITCVRLRAYIRVRVRKFTFAHVCSTSNIAQVITAVIKGAITDKFKLTKRLNVGLRLALRQLAPLGISELGLNSSVMEEHQS